MIRIAATMGLCVALLWMVSCSPRQESDQQLRQQAQQATERAKVAAQKAAADARIAAANAERDANDVAQGVKAGLHNGQGAGAGTVDVNSASRASLESLPGVTPAVARRIANNRPYSSPHDMVRKGAITQAEYDRIAGNVTAQ
ncbi:MAG: helix-hairpin-helix domain-containing protein [Acidobacteriaceae bacterium]